jgi:hypothetical protein
MARRTFDVMDICEIFVHWHAGPPEHEIAARGPPKAEPAAGTGPAARSRAAFDKRIEGFRKTADDGPDDDDGMAGSLARTG